jgi:hypothetical protein
MCCPKCGTENPDDAQFCRSCHQDLSDTSLHAQAPTSQTSVLAIVALVLGIFSILAFFTKVLALSVGISAIILGIVALIKIKQSSGRLKGRDLATTGIVIPAVWILMTLIGLTLNMVKRPPDRPIRQLYQFHSINVALELFSSEFDGFPPSDALDPISRQYCGTMKLAEAMMGQDLLGFHPDSRFRADGMDGGIPLYVPATEQERMGHVYLPLEKANANELQDLYANTAGFKKDSIVLCDEYRRVIHRGTGKGMGMPILYYKADTSKTAHNLDNPDDPDNIYNYRDNHALVGLGVPRDPNEKHPLFTDPKIFYKMTSDYKATAQSKPFRADSFILLSAGYDGLYGTKDDIVNFDK